MQYTLTPSKSIFSVPVKVSAFPFQSVSCINMNTCLAIDSIGNIFEWLHGVWSKTPHASGLPTAAALSCTSAPLCVVVDSTSLFDAVRN
jgi:hypothetical protein